MRTRINVRLTRYGLLLGALGLWEAGGRAGAIDPFFFPLPSSIVAQVAEWAATPRIYADLAITLTETLLGFGAGTLLGVMLGLWLGLSPFVRHRYWSRFSRRSMRSRVSCWHRSLRIVVRVGILASKVAIVVTLVFLHGVLQHLSTRRA